MKDKREQDNQRVTVNNDDNKKVDLTYDTLTGFAVYAVFGVCLMAAYVGIFGYCGGYLIHYALADTLGMPVSFETCYRWGLLPGLNIILFFIAGQVLMWKFLFGIGWDALLWLLDVLPSFLREWSNNLR
jgi:hypothetical protein